MPLDPDRQRTVRAVSRSPHLSGLGEDARGSARSLPGALQRSPISRIFRSAKSEQFEVPGPAGPLALRAYTPVAAGGPTLPAIVYFHGGGFVMGDLDTHDTLCRTLANESGCRIFSVDLSPRARISVSGGDR